jgi:uncharacterized protein (DUF2164 family)
MAIELDKADRQQALLSIQKYFEQHMEERIGNVAASGLLNFFLQEVGPLVFNQAVAQAQERLQARVSEIDIEVHEEPFQYWPKHARPARGGKR